MKRSVYLKTVSTCSVNFRRWLAGEQEVGFPLKHIRYISNLHLLLCSLVVCRAEQHCFEQRETQKILVNKASWDLVNDPEFLKLIFAAFQAPNRWSKRNMNRYLDVIPVCNRQWSKSVCRYNAASTWRKWVIHPLFSPRSAPAHTTLVCVKLFLCVLNWTTRLCSIVPWLSEIFADRTLSNRLPEHRF